MTQGLWQVQSDTLGSSPVVASFLFSPFSPSRLGSNEASMILELVLTTCMWHSHNLPHPSGGFYSTLYISALLRHSFREIARTTVQALFDLLQTCTCMS